MLAQPILAPQGAPDTQAAPSPVLPSQVPAPSTPGDRPDRSDDPPPAPDQTEMPDDIQVRGADPQIVPDIPHRPATTPPDTEVALDIVEVPVIPSVTTVADLDDDVIAEDAPFDGSPAEATPRQHQVKASDPRDTNRRAGQPDIAERPDWPAFPVGWPWHERLGNQGNGKGFGPPGGTR
jgi:hypothetical protein